MPEQNPDSNIPNHVAIVMDGNGRWATSQGLSRLSGHNAGVDNVRDIMDAAQSLGIQYLTLYAFSTENWSRPQEEVSGLMALLEAFLKEHQQELVDNQIRFHVIGDTHALPDTIITLINDTLEKTQDFNTFNLVLALNYGSRNEILNAFKRTTHAIERGELSLGELTWDSLASRLDTAHIPDPDLIIRTSGEHRLSNFLLLQAAYAEILFTDTLWPDFNKEHFNNAIAAYQSRERRFGNIGPKETLQNNKS